VKKLAMCLAFLLPALSPHTVATADRLSVAIQAPKDGSSVSHRNEVSGTVSDPNADVWVVIRPIETSDFWIQPPVTVRKDGSWKVLVYFGEAGPKHAGKRFEVRAFANPTDQISEGKRAQWPKAAGRSDIVEVTRN
jgi:hypothetical protein